jgi:lipopolysaccharide/colanic/teichoic acid biosynthesis glycosyltransferase
MSIHLSKQDSVEFSADIVPVPPPPLPRPVELAFVATAALITLPVTLPIGGLALFAICAESLVQRKGENPIFIQKRVGRFNREFSIYKLRTMTKYDWKGNLLPEGQPPRTAFVGGFLRKCAIDELLQLINILFKGDMSLWGPRARVEMDFDNVSDEVRRMRQSVLPGIFSRTAVHRKRLARKGIALSIPEQMQLDVEYIYSRTFWKDIQDMIQGLGLAGRGDNDGHNLKDHEHRINPGRPAPRSPAQEQLDA